MDELEPVPFKKSARRFTKVGAQHRHSIRRMSDKPNFVFKGLSYLYHLDDIRMTPIGE